MMTNGHSPSCWALCVASCCGCFSCLEAWTTVSFVLAAGRRHMLQSRRRQQSRLCSDGRYIAVSALFGIPHEPQRSSLINQQGNDMAEQCAALIRAACLTGLQQTFDAS